MASAATRALPHAYERSVLAGCLESLPSGALGPFVDLRFVTSAATGLGEVDPCEYRGLSNRSAKRR